MKENLSEAIFIFTFFVAFLALVASGFNYARMTLLTSAIINQHEEIKFLDKRVSLRESILYRR